jgi:hypothetical protein
VPEALSLGVKRPRREAHHSLPSTAEVKIDRAIPPLPKTASMALWQGQQEQLCFTFTAKQKGKSVPTRPQRVTWKRRHSPTRTFLRLISRRCYTASNMEECINIY